MKTFSITNIAWNEETSRFYEENAPDGLKFYNLDTLFGHVMVTGEIVIANEPGEDARGGGIPEGHPPLNAFLGLPIRSRGEMLGMAGLANKPGGFTPDDVAFLEPLLLTCGNYIRLLWDEREVQATKGALVESELRAQAILDSSLDAIITINDDGHIVSANRATSKQLGYEIEELLGQNVKMLMPEPYRSQHDSYIERYLQTGEAKIIGFGREVQAQRKDGSRFPIELAITEFSTPGKHHFTGVIKDISKRKIAKARLEETRQLLQEANDNMLAILDETRNGVLMVNSESRIEFANKAMETITEKRKEDLLGEPWDRVLPLTALQKQGVRSLFKDEERMQSRLQLGFEIADGRDIWTDVQISDDPRNSGGKIMFFYDVTEVRRLRFQLSASAQRRIVGTSPKIRGLLADINKVAMGDWTVLIEGETGVGKELVANAIHTTSPRKEGPFIAINCGGLTESLLTSQLFGYRRGAFTGAAVDHEGFFEAANGGTLFLDEIGDIPPSVQTAMLRVLEEREVTRVGETKPRKIDVRILAATNRDLSEEVAAQRFRRDLFYRIRVANIRVPALRERGDDIPLLAKTFLSEAAAQADKQILGIDPAALKALSNHGWPGNVRELKNAIEIAAINCETQTIEAADLPREIVSPLETPNRTDDLPRGAASGLEDALRRAGGNRSKAAKLLGISRATLYRHLAEAGLGPKRKN